MSYNDKRRSPLWLIFGICGAILLSLLLFFTSTARVDRNEVGIVSNGGAIDTHQAPLSPGWHTIVPFVQGVDTFPTNQQNHQFSEVAASAKNLQNVYVDGGVNYHVDPAHAAELSIQGGSDAVINRVLWPAFQDFIKEVVPSYDTTDILAHRSDIRNTVKDRLSGKTDQFGLFVDDVFLTNIHFDKSYEAAIAAAASAQQDLVRARTEAQAKVAAAQGDADANKLRQQTLTDQVLQQKALDNQQQMIQKWNGQLPQYVGGTSNPFISLGPQPTK